MAGRWLRRAAVAGYFYPREPEALREELRRLTDRQAARVQATAAIVPHAGYQFSGAITGETLSQLVIPRRCVILGPNHTGWGPAWSLMVDGAYETPLGEVPIDEALTHSLLEACPLLTADALGHRGEHAIEVELPFLQWLGPEGLSIVPLVVGSEDPEEFAQVAEGLARLVRHSNEPVLLVASSDFTHYEPKEVAETQDARLIEAIEALDEQRFVQQVQALRMSVCGYGPIACVLGAARRLGATGARLIRYATSADAGSDPHSVVGYAGLVLN